jgi:hypothetical protein
MMSSEPESSVAGAKSTTVEEKRSLFTGSVRSWKVG